MSVEAAVGRATLLASVDTVAALPTTVCRLARLVADGECEIADVVQVVSLDQGLTATLLRRANSAASGSTAPVGTIREAVVRLGTGPVLTAAFAATVSGLMRGALQGYDLAEGELWRRSVAASVAADVVRIAAREPVSTEASTAALMHDIGKVVIAQHFGPQVFAMLDRARRTEGITLLDAERAVFGVHHADLGGILAAHWRLPRTISGAVMRHHDAAPDMTPLEAAVSLAHDLVPAVLGPEDGSGAALECRLAPERRAVVLGVLGLAEREYDELGPAARERYADVAEAYGAT